jgi:hypothetical protein
LLLPVAIVIILVYPIAPSSVAPSSSSPVATVVIVAIIVNFDASHAVAILVVFVVFVGHRRSLSLSPVAIVSNIFSD